MAATTTRAEESPPTRKLLEEIAQLRAKVEEARARCLPVDVLKAILEEGKRFDQTAQLARQDMQDRLDVDRPLPEGSEKRVSALSEEEYKTELAQKMERAFPTALLEDQNRKMVEGLEQMWRSASEGDDDIASLLPVSPNFWKKLVKANYPDTQLSDEHLKHLAEVIDLLNARHPQAQRRMRKLNAQNIETITSSRKDLQSKMDDVSRCLVDYNRAEEKRHTAKSVEDWRETHKSFEHAAKQQEKLKEFIHVQDARDDKKPQQEERRPGHDGGAIPLANGGYII